MVLFGLRGRREQPPRVPTDEVSPARVVDDSPAVRPVVIQWIARFDHVLDAEKLHISLEKLLGMEGWRRLGGRLRLDV